MSLSHRSAPGSSPISGLGRALLLTLAGSLVAGVALAWLAGLRGSVGSIEPASSTIALQAGGADPLVAIAYVGVGLVRLYLTALPLAFLLLGLATAPIDRAWASPAALLFGVASAATLTVLTGCHCGDGASAFLLQRAVEALLSGSAPLPI
jgi:hypothetical protein